MKRWAWVVAALYVATLVVLTVPALVVAFAQDIKTSELTKLPELMVAAATWTPYWLWLILMCTAQVCLLAVPVRMAEHRPVSHGPVWQTILAGGMMAGALAAGAFLSLYEYWSRGNAKGDWGLWTALLLAVGTWCAWAIVFLHAGRTAAPLDLVSRQCRTLLAGSVLELLIAVPTHIIARHRNYCCAGILTFFGLTMGVSVMLFAFGPVVFLLFVERWKRLHRTQNRP
jgi:hypothetical protein